ncbi:DUF3870 domain-containing protein [Brevibacillus ginsengisoli]|uniref:DUF3870 domain-containing protein n=1 Tax=Brevibacillus ginsengisoli TaxID=363854 RepID=UPI003CEFE337
MNTYFFAGHARLPQGMAATSVYETLTITVEIEPKYGVILTASCTLATQQGRDFVGNLLRGHSLKEDMDEIIHDLHQYYRGRAVNALIAAVKDIYSQYEQFTHQN